MASIEAVYAVAKRMLLQRAYAEERWDALDDATDTGHPWITASCNVLHLDGNGNPILCPNPNQFRMRVVEMRDRGSYG